MEATLNAAAAWIFSSWGVLHGAVASWNKYPLSFSPLISFPPRMLLICECGSWCWQKCVQSWGAEFRTNHLTGLELTSSMWTSSSPTVGYLRQGPREAASKWALEVDVCTSLLLTEPWNQLSWQNLAKLSLSYLEGIFCVWKIKWKHQIKKKRFRCDV